MQEYVMCTGLSSLPDKASVVVCRRDNEGIPVADEPGLVCRTARGRDAGMLVSLLPAPLLMSSAWQTDRDLPLLLLLMPLLPHAHPRTLWLPE